MKSMHAQANTAHASYMRTAIGLAYQGMAGRHGGPFGAVIVRDGVIIGQGHNRVLSTNDPTAHAEITAIRDASANIANFDLSGCEIFINAQPCPMCLAAILWARIGKIYYACTAADAETIGFDDQEFYRQLALPSAKRRVPMAQVHECYDDARACFQSWADNAARVPY